MTGIQRWPLEVGEACPAGHGSLRVECFGKGSVVTAALAASPLRLLTPRNHGSAAWVYAGTYGGGLVDGDAISLDVAVGDGATAMVSTQASTKVYRSRRTSYSLRGTVARGGVLAILPEPVVCFASANYRQEQYLHLAEGAGLVFMDWLSSGRRAAGERWQFDSYFSRLEVHRLGRLELFDALSLGRSGGSVAARMGRFNVLCVIVLMGPMLAANAARALAFAASQPLAHGALLMVAASPVGADGCIVRLAGTSVEEVAGVARDCLAFVPALLGDDPWARKW